MSYTIQRDPAKVLVVEYPGRGEVGRVPLASSLPMPWMLRHNALSRMPEDERANGVVEFFYDLFKRYCGNVVDELTMDEMGALIEAWGNATEDAEGVSAGE